MLLRGREVCVEFISLADNNAKAWRESLITASATSSRTPLSDFFLREMRSPRKWPERKNYDPISGKVYQYPCVDFQVSIHREKIYLKIREYVYLMGYMSTAYLFILIQNNIYVSNKKI